MKLTKYQLDQAKNKTVKNMNGIEILKKENAELREKMKLYLRLIEEQKVNIERKELEAN